MATADQLNKSRKEPSAPFIVASYTKAGAGTMRDVMFFVNKTGRPLRVLQIVERHGTAETTAGSLSVTVKKVASAQAVSAGTALHATGADLKATADTNISPTLTATLASLKLADGDGLGADFSAAGTEIADVCISVLLIPVN
jgi:hypothetical protein